ncbi:MAG: hypothetical protein ACK56F_01840, partial [bacterium]
IGFFRIPDPRSQTHIFESIGIENFLGKNFNNSLKIGPIFFLKHFKNNIIQFCEICDYKKSMIKP